MDEARKNAFRRVLYAAMLDFRGHWPINPYQKSEWSRPWLFPKIARRLREIQLMADWLHNLAEFAANDFERFDERFFWKDYEQMLQHNPALHKQMGILQSQFEQDIDPTTNKWMKVREWGVAPPQDGPPMLACMKRPGDDS